jgi:rhodanese-related sulfurtransferase
MDRLFEYTTNHPFLVAAAAILLVLVIVIEIRQRGRGSNALGTNEAIHLTNKGALVIDARPQADYAAGHIIDARNIPVTELAAHLDGLKKKYKQDKPILVYCENGAASARAARLIGELGFTKVFTLRGGLQSWRQDNLPLVKSDGSKGK